MGNKFPSHNAGLIGEGFNTQAVADPWTNGSGQMIHASSERLIIMGGQLDSTVVEGNFVFASDLKGIYLSLHGQEIRKQSSIIIPKIHSIGSWAAQLIIRCGVD